jgi:anti-sigma factor RsiW
MNCAWVQERLLLYLAGELDPPQTARLLRHLEHCPSCTATAERLGETAGQVEAALPTAIEAPATLDARVMEVVRNLPAPRRAWPILFPRRPMLHRLALGSAVLTLMIASFFAGHWQAVVTLARKPEPTSTLDLALLGATHRQLLQAELSTEVKVNNPVQLAQVLTPLLPFPVAIVDLQGDGMRLVGGSKATVHGVPVAALHYRWKGQRISLFQVDGRQLSPSALRQVVFRSDSYFVRKTDGLTYVTWSFGRTNCVMVAQSVPMHLLFQLACHTSEKLERT